MIADDKREAQIARLRAPPGADARAQPQLREATEEELQAQRQSWARGQIAMGNDAAEARYRDNFVAPGADAMAIAQQLERDDTKPWDEDFRTAVARVIEAAAADARARAIEEADAVYHKLWDQRAIDGNDPFTNGLLAGMTELMNEIRALANRPPR